MNMKILSLSVSLFLFGVGNANHAFDKKGFYESKRSEVKEKHDKLFEARRIALRDQSDAERRFKAAKEELDAAEKKLAEVSQRVIELNESIPSNDESIYVYCMSRHLKALAAGNRMWIEGPMRCGEETSPEYQRCYQAYQIRKRAENDALLLQKEAEKLSMVERVE